MENEERFFYAVISKETNICAGIIDTYSEMNFDNHILIDNYDISLVGKKYNNGNFEDVIVVNSNIDSEYIIVNGLKINLNKEFRDFLKLAIESNKNDINILTYDKVYVKLSNVELVYIQEKIEDYDTSDKLSIIYF